MRHNKTCFFFIGPIFLPLHMTEFLLICFNGRYYKKFMFWHILCFLCGVCLLFMNCKVESRKSEFMLRTSLGKYAMYFNGKSRLYIFVKLVWNATTFTNISFIDSQKRIQWNVISTVCITIKLKCSGFS